MRFPDVAMAALAAVIGVMTIAELVRKRRVALVQVGVGVTAAVLAIVGLPPSVEWPLLVGAAAALVLVVVGVYRALHRAYMARDQEAVARYARLGVLLTDDDQWTTVADMGAWRDLAETDRVAARPLLERAAHRIGSSQEYYLLLLEATYGHVDVPALIEQRWPAAKRKERSLLLHLAIGELIEKGRTTEALAWLGRVTAADVTRLDRPLILAEVAAAIGDEATLEAILAEGHPLIDDGVAELHRAIAERARGATEAGDHRLRSLDVPPAGMMAHLAATRLAQPNPVFDELQLDDAARRGLALYRDLSRQLTRT